MSAKKNLATLICERCWQFKRDAEQICAAIDRSNGCTAHMPLIDGMTAFNKEADGEGHFEVHTQLNKIKILFN